MKVSEAVSMAEEQTGRSVAICSLTGSRNYSLSTDGSDHDIKAFVIPSLDDMYERSEYFKEIKGDGYEIRIHDLRRLPDLLWKSNPTYLEIIFSKEMYILDPLRDLLYRNRDRIAGMNLPYLYNSSIGLYRHEVKYIEKGTIGTQHLVERYGYDTKKAMHAYRSLYILQWFMDSGDLEKAIRYDDPVIGKGRREFFLNIKNGRSALDEVRKELEQLLNETEERCRDWYLKAETDREMEVKIRTEIKKFILDQPEIRGTV